MKVLFLFLGISFLSGCATSGPGVKVMDEMAQYNADLDKIQLGVRKGANKIRRNENIALAWRHGEDLPSGDYFWGGWISIVVNKAYWTVEDLKNEPPN